MRPLTLSCPYLFFAHQYFCYHLCKVSSPQISINPYYITNHPTPSNISESESRTYNPKLFKTHRITRSINVTKCPQSHFDVNINQSIEPEGSFDDDDPHNTHPLSGSTPVFPPSGPLSTNDGNTSNQPSTCVDVSYYSNPYTCCTSYSGYSCENQYKKRGENLLLKLSFGQSHSLYPH